MEEEKNLSMNGLDDFDFDDVENANSKLVLNPHKQRINTSGEKEYVMYVVTDRPKSNLINYFRTAGLNVSKIFDSIQAVRDALLLLDEPCRLVIMETGLGKFTNMNARKEIIDTLGLSDEENNITVFYTDNVLKNDTKESTSIDYKEIQWFKYNSTADTVARLLLNKEHYILADNADQIDEDDITSALDKKAIEIKHERIEHTVGIPSITTDNVNQNWDSPDYEQIKKYKVKY